MLILNKSQALNDINIINFAYLPAYSSICIKLILGGGAPVV